MPINNKATPWLFTEQLFLVVAVKVSLLLQAFILLLYRSRPSKPRVEGRYV